MLVWRLDRWGRSVTDLLATLQELEHLGVGFVSLTEALDLTTPVGRAMAGLLAIFAEYCSLHQLVVAAVYADDGVSGTVPLPLRLRSPLRICSRIRRHHNRIHNNPLCYTSNCIRFRYNYNQLPWAS